MSYTRIYQIEEELRKIKKLIPMILKMQKTNCSIIKIVTKLVKKN